MIAFNIVSSRPDGLFALLQSIHQTGYAQWPILVAPQRYTVEQLDALDLWRGPLPGLRIHPMVSLQGPHAGRRLLLRQYRADWWCNLDDDMVLIPELTRYQDALLAATTVRKLGIMSCNWAKTVAGARKKDLGYRTVPQAIVYTGGGAIYSQEVADLIAASPLQKPLFDDVEWSLAAYLAGYQNVRFLGSLAAHAVCGRGGLREWAKEKGWTLPDPRYIASRPGKGEGVDSYHICSSTDLTPLARGTHAAHRSALLA